MQPRSSMAATPTAAEPASIPRTIRLAISGS
jgi:hypothetical protein